MLRCPLSRQEAVPGQQGKGWHVQGMPFCSNPRTMDRNSCSNALLGSFCHLFLKKPNQTRSSPLRFLAVDEFHKGFLGAHLPPKFGVKASPCSNKIGEGNKVVLPTALSWGHRGCPAVVPGHGWKMLPTSGKGKGLSPLPTSFSSDLCVPQKGLLISQC